MLTLPAAQHRLRFDILQAWEAGKAVRIGHGPATVIGDCAVSQDTLPAAEAGTLRERGWGVSSLVSLARLFYFYGRGFIGANWNDGD
jgi:hypothetical protein